MTKNKHIFDLVHSLEKKEKRSFKIFSQSYDLKAANNVIVLFDLINKQKVFNEAVLKAKFKKQYAYEKHRLKENILNFLCYNRRETTPETQCQLYIEKGKICIEKKLFNLAQKQLAKGLEIAEEHQLFYFKFELCQYRLQLLNMEAESNKKPIAECLIQLKDAHKQLSNESKFITDCHQEIHSLKAPNSIQTFGVKSKGWDFQVPETFKSRLNKLKLELNKPLENFETSLNPIKKFIALFEEYPDKIAVNFRYYITVLLKEVKLYASFGHYKIAIIKLEEAKATADNHPTNFTQSNDAYFYSKYTNTYLHLLLLTEDYQQIENYIENNTELIERSLPFSTEKQKSYYYLNAIMANFALGNFQKLEHLIFKAESEVNNKQFFDNYFHLKLYSILVQYEKQNEMLMASQVDSINYLYRKNEFHHPYYLCIVQFLKKLGKHKLKEEILEFVKECIADLNKLECQTNKSKSKVFKAWLKNKTQTITTTISTTLLSSEDSSFEKSA